MSNTHSKDSLKIAFCHLDLGVGGAERFIVDSALEIQNAGHTVHLFTSHYDPLRCFRETEQLYVQTAGAWIPRCILGVGTAACSWLRMMAIAWAVHRMQRQTGIRYDCVIIDQVSIIVPFLAWLASAAHIIFYGHFPDLLLAQHSSPLRRAYRALLDWGEARSTIAAHTLLVNSRFTRDVYLSTFPRLSRPGAPQLQILYPSVRVPTDAELARDEADWRRGLDEELVNWLEGGSVLLSLNRYERKKNLGLALRALRETLDRHALSSGACAAARLVVAGGHDPRVPENEAVLQGLRGLAAELDLEDRVVFLKNISDAERRSLLAASKALVYTPENEHFGIVPLEAMACGRPVVACASGGPLETVSHLETGLLSEPTALAFANSIVRLLSTPAPEAELMKAAARRRMQECFARPAFARAWADVLAKGPLRVGEDGCSNPKKGR